MRLFKNELRKIWRSSTFLLCLAVLLLANLLLLWFDNQAQSGSVPGEAYRAMHAALRYLSEEEKLNYLQTQHDTLLGVMQIDTLVQNAAWNGGDPREGHEELFEQYGEIYSRRIYPYYTASLGGEYGFYAKLLLECKEVADYEGFLAGVQAKAQQLSAISIFNTEKSGFEQANIAVTAAAYAGIPADLGEKLCYAPQKGLQTALSYTYTDLLLLFGMLLVASVSVRDERDSGLLALVRSTAGGRLATARCKLLAMAASVLALVALLYGSNLAYCAAVYGLPKLSAPVQSVPFLLRSTHMLTVGGYLGAFLLTKWLAAAVLGVWVLLAGLVCRRPMAGWLLALALPAAFAGIRQAIPATSRLNVLKYANLISLLQTNELLGSYRSLYWFGRPVPLPLVAVGAAMVFSLLLIPAFLLVFCRAVLAPAAAGDGPLARLGQPLGRLSSRALAAALPHRHKKGGTTLWREEARKLFVFQGAALLLAALLGLSVWQAATQEEHRTIDEMYYSYYMQHLSGPFDLDAYQWLATEDSRLQPLYDADRAYANGSISATQHDMIYMANYDLQQRQKAQNNILSTNFAWLKDHEDAQLVYETPYLKLFDLDDTVDKQEALLTSLVTVLCCAGIFAYEKKGGMLRVLRATPGGQGATVGPKLALGAGCGALAAAFASLPRLVRLASQYGFYALNAPALSLKQYQGVAATFTLSDLVAVWLLLRMLAGVLVALLTMALSQRQAGTLRTILTGCLGLCLPLLLAQSGMLHIKWAGIYPLFHFTAILGGEGGAVLWAWPLAAMLLCAACAQYLLESYREEV